MAFEFRRRHPASCLVVQRGDDRPQSGKMACLCRNIGFPRHDIGEQFAIHPTGEAGPAPLSGRRYLDLHEVLAVQCQQRFGRRDARLDQGAGPETFGSERHDVVVPRAMQSQRQRGPVPRIGHLESDVLAQMHEA